MGCGHGRVGHSEHVGTSAVLTPAVNGREAAEDPVRIGDGSKRPNREGLREQPLPKLIGFSDRTQGRVQQRHAVAQAFGLLEAVRGQEDRHPALTEPVDQIVHLPGDGRVQARSGLVITSASSLSKALARLTRWRRPLDSLPQGSLSRSARLTALRTRSTLWRASDNPYRPAKHSRFSATVSRRYRPGDSGMTEML